MKVKHGYLPVEAAFPFEGLNTTITPAQLPPGASPNAVNMSSFRGTLQRRRKSELVSAPGGEAGNVLGFFPFQTSAGNQYLVMVTPTKVWRLSGGSWTDITPTVTKAKFTIISAGNGWTLAGAPSVGDFVTQATTGAIGQWAGSDATYYYIVVTQGIFNASGTVSGSGFTLTLSGTDPNRVARTMTRLPIYDDITGWQMTLGNFTVGQTVSQETSSAAGVWYKPDSTYYYIKATSGTFDDQSAISVTSVEGSGTLEFTGSVAATSTATVIKGFPKLSGSDGWEVSAGVFANGDAVTQDTSGATGVWRIADADNFYIQVSGGSFDTTNDVDSATATISVTGSAPALVTQGVQRFPIASWTLTGTFDVGVKVEQQATSASGIWLVPDATYYYIQVVSGTFGDKDSITVTTLGETGTLTHTGVTGAASTTTLYDAPTASGAMVLSGSTTQFIDFAEGVDVNLGKILVITNGKDWPMYWTGTGTCSLLPVNYDTFRSAKTVAIFNNYLIFGNITTSSGIEDRSVIWSDTGNFQEWMIGSSGLLAEIAVQGQILRMIPFIDKLILFSERTIGCLCYVDPDVIFGSKIYVQNIRVAGHKAIVSIPPYCIYASQDNVYMWDGGSGVSPIGDRIALTYRSVLYAPDFEQTQLQYDPSLRQIHLIVPIVGSSFRAFMLELASSGASFYDLQKSHNALWFEETWTDYPTCLGLAWDESVDNGYLTWARGASAGQIFLANGEGNSVVTGVWDTKDFTIPLVYQSQLARWLELEFEATGTTVTTKYSTDGGANWTDIETTTLSSTSTSYKVLFDVTARYIRFRFTCTTEITLSWYRVWFRAGGAR
jgi:hypothetical protein